MRILSICKTPSVFACGKSSSLKEEAQPSLSLRDISPRGRDEFGLCVRAKKSAQGKSHAYLVNL